MTPAWTSSPFSDRRRSRSSRDASGRFRSEPSPRPRLRRTRWCCSTCRRRSHCARPQSETGSRFYFSNGPPRVFVFAAVGHFIKGKQYQCITIKIQKTCSKQSSLFSFYPLPSGGKPKCARVHCWITFGALQGNFIWDQFKDVFGKFTLWLILPIQHGVLIQVPSSIY